MKTYYDISGDGGSNIVQQVEEQGRRITDALAGVGHLVAIGSGKGGVGKSTLTRHLALALATTGWRVAILDADLNGPTQARLAGLGAIPLIPRDDGRVLLPRDPQGVGVVSMGTLVPESEAVDFSSVAEGDSHIWRATREFALLGQLLGSMEWGELDALLFDLPPGAERTFQFAEALGPRTAFVLVTLPSDLARGVVSRSAAALARTANPVLGLIENMKGYYCSDCASTKPLFPDRGDVEVDLPLLGSVPFDPELAELCDRGGSILDAPESGAAKAIMAIAGAMRERLEGLSS